MSKPDGARPEPELLRRLAQLQAQTAQLGKVTHWTTEDQALLDKLCAEADELLAQFEAIRDRHIAA